MEHKLIKQIITDIIKDELGNDVGIFLFGSRAKNEQTVFSDYDIGLFIDEEIQEQMMSNIRNEIENSNIPFTVDIIDFSVSLKQFKNIALENVKIWNNHSRIKSLITNLKS